MAIGADVSVALLPNIVCIYCWNLGRTNSLTSARRGDGLEYIRIWATPLRRLVFWDGAQVLQVISEPCLELSRSRHGSDIT